MIFSDKTLDEFETITGLNLRYYFSDVNNFFTNYQQNIIDFYDGVRESQDSESFDFLNSLLITSKNINSIISQNKTSLTNVVFWDLLEWIEEIEHNLQKTQSISIFLKSNLEKGTYNTDVSVDIPLTYNRTVESTLNLELGDADYQNNSQEVLLKNDLIEESYSSKGGVLLKTTLRNPQKGTKIKVIVDDNIVGQKMYGVDVQKTIEFDTELKDLKYLSEPETVRQAVEILTSLQKGHNPEFPSDGIDPNLLVGSSVGALTFPVLFRQVSSLFAGDDTLTGFAIKDIRRQEDGLFIDYEVNTVYNETLSVTSSHTNNTP